MAGPWFVDPENGSTSNTGLSEGSPWQLIPGQVGASAQTGYGVVAGDIVNVKNGTVSTGGQIQPPANNLTYRGYGLADNVLTLTLPASNPANARTVRVVRESGVHEGMWTVDGSALSTSVIDVPNARTGVTIEDVHVIGGSVNGVTLGTTAAGAQSGITMRRFWIDGAGANGVSCYKINALLEWFKISGTVGDGWIIGATAANSYRSGASDTVRYFEIVEPNVNRAGSLVGDGGDGWQLFHADGRFESALSVHDFQITKSNAVKQGFLVHDALGGITIRRFRIIGTPGSCGSVYVSCVRGNLDIFDGYWQEGIKDNAVVRMRRAETALAQLLYTGARIRMRRLLVVAGGVEGFFDAADGGSALEMDGTLEIENCTVKADVAGALSYAGFVSLIGGTTTYGSNFVLALNNNAFDGSGTGVRLPTGVANVSRYAVRNNAFRGGHTIGATNYADTAALQSAHSAATGNVSSDPLLNSDGSPLPGSPLISAGIHLGYRMDVENHQYWNPPTIGAYEWNRPRGVR